MDVTAVMTLLANSLGIANEDRSVLNSIQSARKVDSEGRQLCINKAQRTWLFEELEDEGEEEKEGQHDDNAKPGHVSGSSRFAPAGNDGRSRQLRAGVVDLTSHGEE